jgi:hypothetical protein
LALVAFVIFYVCHLMIHAACLSLQRANVVVRMASASTVVEKVNQFIQGASEAEQAAAVVQISEVVFDIAVATPIARLSQQVEVSTARLEAEMKASKLQLEAEIKTSKLQLEAEMKASKLQLEAEMKASKLQMEAIGMDLTWKLIMMVVVVVAAVLLRDVLPKAAFWQVLTSLIPKG